MKRMLRFLPLIVLVACDNSFKLSYQQGGMTGLDAGQICSGEVIGQVTGTASCSNGSASVAEKFYVLSARNDIASVGDWSDLSFLADLVDGTVNRTDSVLVLQDVYNNSDLLNFFKTKYQVIPNPITDSDGFSSANGAIFKQHFLDRIVGRPNQECGTTGTILQRIDDCEDQNGARAFYNGRQYGQAGEGDWKLVTRLLTGEEVWRDERTKLLWSDKTTSSYNWYKASGYMKDNSTSQAEVGENSSNNQTPSLMSLCAEVDDNGFVVGGGADPLYDGTYTPTSAPTIEKAFKGNLNASHHVVWKLPSIDDYKLADVNGIRKVYRTGGANFWSSSSYSDSRSEAQYFEGQFGLVGKAWRGNMFAVRCVGFSHD